jgi:hypothetical protein
VNAKPQGNPAGRVDLAASKVFHALLARHGNPVLRTAAVLLSDNIAQCFEKELGPGTRAHQVGERMLRLIDAKKKAQCS